MNVFDLFAKISLDSSGYETGLRAAKDLGGKVADGISAVFKASTVAVTAAGTAVAGLAKKSLDASADFEQLVGGVDKIFGESSKKVQEYANQAYKTAGLSANEYMQTVTGFSASLLQSLGGDTEKAAETANRAIIDMADNMNTYGSDMSSIQNAYQGFAKQNYTMLDNLKLGYGGTKEEMARLIEDASGLDEEMKALGVTVDKDSMEFGNIINAISVMQQHMKIAGTTSKEAAGTISGSISSMKAAWQNFLTGTGSAKQFSDVLSISIENISEKLDVIIPRLSEGLTELVTQISPEIPKIMEKTLPTVIQGASTLITGLANGLPQLITAILPSLTKGIVNVTRAVAGVLPQLVQPVIDSAKIIGDGIFDLFIKPLTENSKKIGESASIFISNLALKITDSKSLEKIGATAGDIIKGFADGLATPEAIDKFIEAAPRFLTGLANGIKAILVGSDETGGLFGAIEAILNNVGEWFSNPENRDKFEAESIKFLDALCNGITTILEHAGNILLAASKMFLDTFLGDIDYDSGGIKFIESLSASIKKAASNLGGILGGMLGDDSALRFQNAYNWAGTGTEEDFRQSWNNLIQTYRGMGYSDELAEQLAYEHYMSGNQKDFWSTGKGQEYLEKLQQNEIDEANASERMIDELMHSPTYMNSSLVQERYNNYLNSNPHASAIDRLDALNSIIDFRMDELARSSQMSQFVRQYGDGGIVTKPTLALIGERGEPEAVVPLGHETETSRMLGGVTIQFGDIYVNGESGDIGQQVVQKLDEALRVWQLQQKRGVGGTAWQV